MDALLLWNMQNYAWAGSTKGVRFGHLTLALGNISIYKQEYNTLYYIHISHNVYAFTSMKHRKKLQIYPFTSKKVLKLISSSCIFTINRNLAQLGAAGPNKAVSDLIPGFLRDVSCEGWGAGWWGAQNLNPALMSSILSVVKFFQDQKITLVQ